MGVSTAKEEDVRTGSAMLLTGDDGFREGSCRLARRSRSSRGAEVGGEERLERAPEAAARLADRAAC